MQHTSYPVPPQESERQAALQRYQILDTPPEESFDRLTRLAAQLFDVPVALISLIDTDRQWHKSCYGFDAREVRREVSFCAHNLVGDTVMIVEDTTVDPRFADNPIVTADPHVRFYAGAPLITTDGHSLGSLCILDEEPRAFEAAQQAQLRDLAAMVMDELELRREVAERKRAERELQASEQRFRGLVSNLPGLVYRCTYDAAWSTLYMSHGLEDLGGYPVSAFERGQRSFKEIVVPEDLPKIRQAVREAVTTRSTYEVEYRIRAKDGTIRWIEDMARPCFDEDGRVKWLDGVMFDVTERKQTEERLRLLETAVEDATESVLITDSELDRPGPRILYANSGFEAMTGYRSDEAVGKTPRLLQGPDTDPALLERLRRELENGDSFFGKTVNYRKDGTPFINEWSISPVHDERGEVTHYVAVQRDITEREKTKKELVRYARQLEQTTAALEDAKARTDRILASITDAFFTLDHDGQFTYLNEQAEQLLEHPADELIGENIWDVFADAVGTVFHDEFLRVVDEQEAMQFEAFYPPRQRWYRVHAYPFEDGLSVFFSDVTDRKRAERALQESEEKYRTVVENVKDVVFRTDAEGRLTFLNPAWTEVTGHGVEAALGRRMSTFVHQTNGETDWVEFEALLAGDKDFCRYEVQLKTSDDVPRWMEVFVRPMVDKSGSVVGTSGTLHDVTKWREAEAQMRKALDKERELGRLKSRFVSMASHELRTPLATIQSSAELADLFMQRGATEKTSKHLGRIQNNVDRMAALLEDVLIFGRVESGRLPFEPVGMNLAGLAAELVNDIRQGIGAGHTVHASGVEDEIALQADPQLLRLVLTNLLSNAVKYSPEGSTVRLDVRATEEAVHVTVSDEGIGIPHEDLDRLFEPFHRADNVGSTNGTGLGLAILSEAIDLHEGTVDVDSTEGEGSTFSVTLPRTRPMPDRVDAEHAMSSDL